MRRRLMGAAAGGGGEYIEGTATGEFTIRINSYSGTQYTITPDAAGKWRWDKPADMVITSLYSMFGFQPTVTSIDNWTVDTSTVTDMGYMFSYCNSLTALDVSKFDTSNVTNMNSMFNYCSSLTALDLSKFDTSNVTDMTGMFGSCGNLTALDVSKFDTSNVKVMVSMFGDCSNLPVLDVSNFNTSNVTNMSFMFSSCGNLTALDVSNFDTSNVTDMSRMFYSCGNLTALDVSKFDTSNVTNMSNMFNGCQALTSLTGFAGKDIHSCTNVDGMFAGCDNIKDFDFSGANLSGVTDMSSMFSCNPESVSFKNADLSSVTNMSGMFFVYGGRLKTADFSGCDLSKVTDISSMFARQTNLTAVMFGFYMDNVQNADSTFINCSSLRNFPRIHFAGDSVNISRLCAVAGGSGAMIGEIGKYPDISGGTITSMDYAFANQPNMEMIGLSSNIGLTAAPTQAFAGCTGLKKVYTTQLENEYILAALNTDLPDKKWKYATGTYSAES